ncbi:MAG TPA: DinB family protein [Balneolales bacterium]|nr:DinB family protein [Balneolales bacterium]
MSISESFLPEFDHEMANTRKLLERIPNDKATWKPHPKSRTLGQLAIHLAFLPVWINSIMEKAEFDLRSSKDGGFKRPEFKSRDTLLSFFDENVSNARKAISGRSDREMLVNWTFRKGEQILFSSPRTAALRSFVMSHSIHHRGQLTVYLRLIDVPLPELYGSTADTEAVVQS